MPRRDLPHTLDLILTKKIVRRHARLMKRRLTEVRFSFGTVAACLTVTDFSLATPSSFLHLYDVRNLQESPSLTLLANSD